MPRCRALLLDFYGTLVDEDTDVIEAICQEVCRNAQAASPAEVARTWSSIFRELTSVSLGTAFRLQRGLAQMSLAATVSRYHSTADPDALLEAQFSYWQRPRIQPDTQELLATTLPACLVSNIDRADLVAALAHHGLASRFAHLVTSQDARAYKPRPEMFRAALALLGLGPDEVIHVGDSLSSDVAGAQRLGIPAASVNPFRRTGTHSGARLQPTKSATSAGASPARRVSAATIGPLPVTHHPKKLSSPRPWRGSHLPAMLSGWDGQAAALVVGEILSEAVSDPAAAGRTLPGGPRKSASRGRVDPGRLARTWPGCGVIIRACVNAAWSCSAVAGPLLPGQRAPARPADPDDHRHKLSG